MGGKEEYFDFLESIGKLGGPRIGGNRGGMDVLCTVFVVGCAPDLGMVTSVSFFGGWLQMDLECVDWEAPPAVGGRVCPIRVGGPSLLLRGGGMLCIGNVRKENRTSLRGTNLLDRTVGHANE